MKKEDDQLILAILSKLGAEYLVFVSTFHVGKLTTPGWKIPTLNAFIESLTSEHDNLLEQSPAATRKAAILVDRQFGEDKEIR